MGLEDLVEIARLSHSLGSIITFLRMRNNTFAMTASRQRNEIRGNMGETAQGEDIRDSMSSKRRKQGSLARFNTINIMMNPLPSSPHPSSTTRLPQCAKIIVGFPGIGKSFISRDLSDQYSWLNIHDEPGYTKGAEDSFLSGVLLLAQKPGVLLLPAHRMVGEFLVSQNLVFTSVFPKRGLKEEYLRRYRERGSPEGLVELVGKRWDLFVDNMWYPKGRCNHVELEEGQFLKDVFLTILMQADANGPAPAGKL